MLHRRISSAVVATRASVKHWMKLESLHCKQPCLLLLVEVEMFKPDCHMKRWDWVNSHHADTVCRERRSSTFLLADHIYHRALGLRMQQSSRHPQYSQPG